MAKTWYTYQFGRAPYNRKADEAPPGAVYTRGKGWQLPTGGAPAGGGGGGGGGGAPPVPDFEGQIDVEVPGEYYDPQKAIQGDWEYTGALAETQQANQNARLQLATQRKQALVDLGIVPAAGLDADALGDIDETTRLEAAKNPYSAFAQAGQAKTRSLDQLQAALGARGTYRGGGSQGGAQKLQAAYEQTTNAATRSTLDVLREALGIYTGGVEQRRVGLQNVAGQVGARLAADPRFQPRVVKALWNPARGGYVSPSGGLYDRYGTKIG